MSIRLLARDLYTAQQEVGRLEKEYASASAEKKARLEAALRNAVTRRDRLRGVLDGQIDRKG